MADKQEKAPEVAKEDKKGGSKKLLIIGLLAGLLLGGGGGFAAFMMMGGDEQQKEPEEKPVVEKPELDLHFVKMERVTIPIIYNHHLSGNMMIDFSMEVNGNENKMAVIHSLPEIRDALLRHFSSTSVGKADSPQSVDYPRLKKTLKDISNKILHDPLVRRVMVVQVRRF